MSPVLFDSRGMPELRQELVAVVTAHYVMRHRDADRGGSLDRTVWSGHQLLQTRPHQRDDPAQLGNDNLGFDVDQPHAGVRLLILDDEPQRTVEFLGAT